METSRKHLLSVVLALIDFVIFGALATVLLGLLLLIAPPALAEPFAYITNMSSNNVSVVDTASNTVVATVAVGKTPTGVAVNPAGPRVYVANSDSKSVSVIDTTTNTVVATVVVGEGPYGVAVNPAGTRVYVANLFSNTVSVIDSITNTVIDTVLMGGGPFGVAINPAGTRVYVADHNIVSVIDADTNAVIATIPVGIAPRGIAVNPAGTRVYVANMSPASNTVSVIDTASNTVIATVPVGEHPSGIAVNPAGTQVYVTNNGSSTLSVIDTASNTVISSATVKDPYGVAVSSDGKRIYVTNFSSDTISVIETRCNAVTSTVTVGQNPVAFGTFIRTMGSWGAPPPGPEPPPDNLRITGMEVTQGIQDLTNSVRLVSGRRIFVRVYVQSDGPAVPGVTATLSGVGSYGTIGGTVTVPLGSLVPVNSVGPRITVYPLPRRSNLNESFLFELPWNWTNFEALRLHAVVSSDPGPPPISCPADVLNAPLHAFEMPMSLKIAFVRLGYQTPGVFPNLGASAQASVLEQNQSESVIRRTYPLTELLSSPDLPLFDAGLGSRVDRSSLECKLMNPDEQDLCAYHYITSRLAALQVMTGFMGDADAAYGLIPQLPDPAGTGLLFTRGACCTQRVGAGPSNSNDYAAHEIGHFLGRMHPLEGAVVCGHSPDDPNYPYPASFIADLISDPKTGLVGFDGGDASLLIPMALISPKNYDTMGYCKPSWVSDYTYWNLYICLSAMNSDLPGVTPGCGKAGDTRPGPAVPESGDWLMVFGNFMPAAGTTAFIHTQRVDRIAKIPLRSPGDHTIRLVGEGGAILADYPFIPDALDDGAAGEGNSLRMSFGHVVPFIEGTQEIQIVDAGNAVIGSKIVSPNPPVISDVTLRGDPVTGPLTVEWEATDPDGDNLSFDIFLIRDTGNGNLSQQPLMLGLSDTTVQIDTMNLSGGTAQLRVVASDGVQSTYADTPLFTLADKPPRPRILNPGNGTTIFFSQSVNLEGGATDPQDGVIPETGLAWSLPGGSLGSGARLSVADLPVGVNRITLTATNSVGLSETASVDVTVKEVVDLPGPTLTAGPGRIGWNVAAGETQLQTAKIEIGNSGSGDLEFTASSSAPWLTLSPVTGTAPATLTVTADPSTFSGGVTKQATVTLTAVGIPGQVIRVPVSLAVGNTFTVAKTGGTPDISVTPLILPFGSVVSGDESAPQEIIVRNDGTAPLHIGTIVGPAIPFSKTSDSCSGQSIGPTEACSLNVRFSPPSAGLFTSNLSISSDSPGEESINVELSGTGVEPEIDVSSTDLDFGRVSFETVAEMSVTIQNSGTSALHIGAVSSPVLPFSNVPDACSGKALGINESCAVLIRFVPTAQGDFESTFDISSDDPDEKKVTVHLSGKGVRFLVSPREGTIGTEIRLSEGNFGVKKGKVSLGSLGLKVVDWSDGTIHAIVGKAIPLDLYAVVVQPKEPKGALAMSEPGGFTIRGPEIDSVEPAAGTSGDPAPVVIKGKFFGMKKGKVWLQRAGEVNSCKVLSWTMDATSGEGEIEFTVPKGLAAGGDYVLTIANKVSSDTRSFAIIAP